MFLHGLLSWLYDWLSGSSSEPVNPGNAEFIVIGAGLPRTGTSSLRMALEQIIGPTYHMKALMTSKGTKDSEFWLNAQMRLASVKDWKQFISDRGLVAGVDYPMAFYWKDLLKMYPNAKVILSIRSPQSWYKSVKESILILSNTLREFPAYHAVCCLPGQFLKTEACDKICNAIPSSVPDTSMFDAVRQSEEKAVDFFNRWVEDVKANVPPEKLLIFEPKQGWEPLCTFLDVPVPSNPFPRANDTASFQKMIRNIKIVSCFILFGIPTFVAVIIGLGLEFYGVM